MISWSKVLILQGNWEVYRGACKMTGADPFCVIMFKDKWYVTGMK